MLEPMPRLLTVVASLALLSTACSSPLTTPSAPVTLTRFASGPESLAYYSGLREPLQRVVRDEGEWREVWSAIWRNHAPKPSLPTVDFAREMVVVAALGERPTGGYGILISSASEAAGGLAIEVRAISLVGACGTTQALTQPVDAARVTRRDGPVVFKTITETQDCR